jgi:diketogulonate reductase-like aldo/keto reductase
MTPRFIYGTAWKEERTEALTLQALRAGFRAVDTANQRKHYFEAGVGAAVRAWLAESGAARDTLWLQTKFTYARGQDHRLPFDANAPAGEQVAQSFASSLEHLGVERIDSYVLHGPEYAEGLSEVDWEVWAAMSRLVSDGRVGALGVSNVSARQLSELASVAEQKPAFVQNRCYARLGWDADVRSICREAGIEYQGFSLLTANQRELQSPVIRKAAQRLSATPAQVVFRFALAVGMIPLTGSSNAQHLKEDLEAAALGLTDEEVRAIEHVSSS